MHSAILSDLSSGTIEQHLVRMKEATASHKVHVIVVVKTDWGQCLKGCQPGISSRFRAVGPSSGGEVGVNVCLVVYASPEEGTLSLAYGVAAGEGGQVAGA